MHSIDDTPDNVPDDVPVADAVEQHRPAVDPSVDDDGLGGGDEAPLEASPSDWQDQHEDVIDADDYDRDG